MASGGSARDNSAMDFGEQKPITYELSLSKKTKKPTKLKPLDRAKTGLEPFEYENAYKKEFFQDLDNDLNSYLDPNLILSQMQSAFSNTTKSHINEEQLTKIKKKKLEVKMEIIGEEPTSSLNKINQVVPFVQSTVSVEEQRAKKNQLLKQRVKQITRGTSNDQPILSITEEKVPEQDVFITGTKIQPTEDDEILKKYDEEMAERKKRKKYYKYQEDELLDELDQHEQDMNEMLKYLTECEDLMKGNDLRQIESMMDVTKETMTQHFQAYDKIKEQILVMDTQAQDAIQSLNFYEPKQPKDNKKKNYDLERVVEEADTEADYVGKQKPSQEHNKKNIVNQLMNMNQSIKDFSCDLESKLDRAYKSGASKKYGYESIVNTSTHSDQEKDKDKHIQKLASQAQQYLDKNQSNGLMAIKPASGLFGMESFSKQGKKSNTSKISTISKKKQSINDDLKM